MATFSDGEIGSSVRSKINAAISTVDTIVEQGGNKALVFADRGTFVAWNDSVGGAPYGSIAFDGTVQYVADSTATAISDLLGWLPFGLVVPDHFDQNTTPGTTDMTSAWAAFLAYLISSGLHGGGFGQYLISDDFVVTSAIKLDLFGCYIKQATDGRGFLQLRGNGHDVRNVDAILATTRTNASGNYRGYSADQRMCVVWAEGGQNEIHNIRGENFFTSLCLRGPVEQNPAAPGYTGADNDPQSTYIYTTLTANNNVTQIWGQTQDFAVTGHQQDGLSLDGYGLRDVTEVAGIPPHAIYMTNDDADCINCSIQNGYCENGTTGVAHKFQRFDRSCSFRNLYATKTAGVANFIENYGYAENLVGLEQNDTDGGDTYICFVSGGSMNIRDLHGSAATDSPCGLITATDGAVAKVSGAKMVSRFPAAGTVASAGCAYAQDTSRIDIHDVTYTKAGSDRVHAFVTQGSSSATITVSAAKTEGTALLANGGGGAVTVYGSANLIEGFDAIAIAGDATFIGPDIEKGTWTPAYTPASGAFDTVTYDQQHGTYVWDKGGSKMTVWASLRTDAVTVGTASGNVTIDGLPEAASADIPHRGYPGAVASTAFTSCPIMGYVEQGSSRVVLYVKTTSNGNAAQLAVGDLALGSNSNDLQFSATYQV